MSLKIFRAQRAIVGSAEDQRDTPVSVVVKDGMIVHIADDAEADLAVVDIPGVAADDLAGAQEVEIPGTQIMLPGLVDTHVHVNEPGRTEWEGFSSVTRAAAAGGVTTLLDMPLNSIPSTVTMEALATKREIAEGKAKINVGFWGGVVPENLGTGELKQLWDTGRVFGFKCFLLHSGVDEFRPLDRQQLYQAMEEIAEFDGLLIVHAEDADLIAEGEAAQVDRGGITQVYSTFEASRPPEAERRAIETVIAASQATGCRAHILHLSDSGSLEVLRDAQARGVRVTAETCPHYLSLFSEEIHNGATQYKCCPPIRTAGNRERLWAGLVDGIIGMIVSDHSPCTAELKKFAQATQDNTDNGLLAVFSSLQAEGNDFGGVGADGRGGAGSFGQAWGGVASVQLGLPVIWSQARIRGLGLGAVVSWMSTAPARWAGLADRGQIAVGSRADFIAVSADEAFVVLPEQLHQKNKVTAYAQRALAGVVHNTWVAGQLVYTRPTSVGVCDGLDDKARDQMVFPGGLVPLVDRP